jgi:hypothetical protein
MQVSGSDFRISGFELQIFGFGFRVSGFGFRVSSFEFRVSSVGVRVYIMLRVATHISHSSVWQPLRSSRRIYISIFHVFVNPLSHFGKMICSIEIRPFYRIMVQKYESGYKVSGARLQGSRDCR